MHLPPRAVHLTLMAAPSQLAELAMTKVVPNLDWSL